LQRHTLPNYWRWLRLWWLRLQTPPCKQPNARTIDTQPAATLQKMPLVYALVIRAADAVPLAQYSAVSGNFEPAALDCWRSSSEFERQQQQRQEQQQPPAGAASPDAGRFSAVCDAHSFNFAVHGGYVFVVVADEGYGQQVPFACCKRIQDAWTERYWEKGMEKTFEWVWLSATGLWSTLCALPSVSTCHH